MLDTSVESMTRLLVLLTYPTEEIVKAITERFGLTEVAAADMVARVKEQTLSFDEL